MAQAATTVFTSVPMQLGRPLRCIRRFPARARLADCTTVNYIFGKRCSGKSVLAEHLLSESGALTASTAATLGLSQVHTELDAGDALHEFQLSAAERAYLFFDDCTTARPKSLLLGTEYLQLLQAVQYGVRGYQCKTTLIVTSQSAQASNTAAFSFAQPDHVFVTNLLGREEELRLVHRHYAAHVVPDFADFASALYATTMGKFGRCLVIARDGLFWYDARSTTLEPDIP